MTTIRKSLIATVLLTSMIGVAQSRAQEASPASTVAARFPAAHETVLAHNGAKAVRENEPTVESNKANRGAPASCVHEHWPYIADECLVASEGVEVNRPSRIIRFERRMADSKLIAVN